MLRQLRSPGRKAIAGETVVDVVAAQVAAAVVDAIVVVTAGAVGAGDTAAAAVADARVRIRAPQNHARGSKDKDIDKWPRLESSAIFLCAEHVRQSEGESPSDNLMEVKS